MDNNRIREKVLEAMCEINEEVMENQDKDLLLHGVIDSFDIVGIMVELEDAFGVEIDAEKVTPDHFRTVDAIVALMEETINQ